MRLLLKCKIGIILSKVYFFCWFGWICYNSILYEWECSLGTCRGGLITLYVVQAI
jgi:hypothetical protein